MANTKEFARVIDDFAEAELGDKRCTKRLVAIAERISANAGQTIPQRFRDPSQAEAVYRFIVNKSVKPENIIQPHNENTAKRAAGRSAVLVI